MSSEVIVTTTPSVEGRTITSYRGIVTGEAVMGANIFKDLFAGIRERIEGAAHVDGLEGDEVAPTGDVADQVAEECRAGDRDAVGAVIQPSRALPPREAAIDGPIADGARGAKVRFAREWLPLHGELVRAVHPGARPAGLELHGG